jgi:hypothetical protein
MIRLFMFVMIAVLYVGGCQTIDSVSPKASALGASGPRAVARVAPPTNLAQADVLVVFGNVAEAEEDPMYCPVAAVTVDAQCNNFSTQGSDIVCRWSSDSGKVAALRRVKWKAVVNPGMGAHEFSITFPGFPGGSPCTAGVLSGAAVTCVGKDAAGLGLPSFASIAEVALKYEIDAKHGGTNCPTLDPSTIWRR